jgi:hypothetical protein
MYWPPPDLPNGTFVPKSSLIGNSVPARQINLTRSYVPRYQCLASSHRASG